MQGLAVTPAELRQQWTDLAKNYKISQLQYRLRNASVLYQLEALNANMTTIIDNGHYSIYVELRNDLSNMATIGNYFKSTFS